MAPRLGWRVKVRPQGWLLHSAALACPLSSAGGRSSPLSRAIGRAATAPPYGLAPARHLRSAFRSPSPPPPHRSLLTAPPVRPPPRDGGLDCRLAIVRPYPRQRPGRSRFSLFLLLPALPGSGLGVHSGQAHRLQAPAGLSIEPASRWLALRVSERPSAQAPDSTVRHARPDRGADSGSGSGSVVGWACMLQELEQGCGRARRAP